MDEIRNRQEYNDSSPHCGSARLTVVTSAGKRNTSIAANLSTALAQRGKHVCLITTDCPSGNRATSNQSWGSPLEDFLAARKQLSEILLDGSAGTQILPAGSTFSNFLQMDQEQQKLLLELLSELETAFDYLVVETPIKVDSKQLHLYQSAPIILLGITPEADSLTAAFALLRALKRRHREQQIHVVVEMAESLPTAHDSFQKLRHAAAKYLQIALHYLGYIPSEHSVNAVKGKPAGRGPIKPNLDSITDRFCAIAEMMPPSSSLSRHYSGLCYAAETVEVHSPTAPVAVIESPKIKGETRLDARLKRIDEYDGLSDVALHSAVYYASLLAQREAQPKVISGLI